MEDFPLELLVATKKALFAVTPDPTLEDARHVLEHLEAFGIQGLREGVPPLSVK